MRPRIYISGPISNGGLASPEQRLRNVKIAADKMAQLIDLGFAPICPQLTEYVERLTGRVFAHDDWMEIDLPWVRVCDAVFRLAGESKGSDIECNYAAEHGIPVFWDAVHMRGHFHARGIP